MNDVRSRRLERMLDDPDLSGDLLLVGLAFARFLDFGGIPPGKRLSTGLVARSVWPTRPPSLRAYTVQRTLAADARTYKPVRETSRCGAPMVRRPGACGRGTSSYGLITDWDTGEQNDIGACSRHREWLRDLRRRNEADRPEHPPLPAANHGGILARHIPEFGWPKIWAWATDGLWVEHPEGTPWRRPTLALHLGDGEGGGARPLLASVDAS